MRDMMRHMRDMMRHMRDMRDMMQHMWCVLSSYNCVPACIQGKWHLLDGDKLAVLFAMFLFKECGVLGLIGEVRGRSLALCRIQNRGVFI